MTPSRFTAESMKGVGFPPPSEATFERLERAIGDALTASEAASPPPGTVVRIVYAELAMIAGARPTPLPEVSDGKAKPFKH